MSQQKEFKTLNLYPIDFPFETLVNRINAKDPKLILNPDFQRKYKWDKEGWQRASRFIESCLMRIPLPSCYFAEEEGGKHLVIDGVQRLTTIKKFFGDEFKLEGMNVFRELEGKKFSELGEYKSELETTTIRCVVLRKENPKSLVREIFSRLNQGAVSLSGQEIRHAIYPGPFDDLLCELGEIPAIKNFSLTANSTKKRDSREPEEQVLRFFAFHERLKTYDGNLSNFLDNFMESKQDVTSQEIEQLRKLFIETLDKCLFVFKEKVFSDPRNDNVKQSLVHYDILMSSFVGLELNKIKKKREKIVSAFSELCGSDAFRRTLSGGLQNRASILRRKTLWDEILERKLND